MDIFVWKLVISVEIKYFENNIENNKYFIFAHIIQITINAEKNFFELEFSESINDEIEAIDIYESTLNVDMTKKRQLIENSTETIPENATVGNLIVNVHSESKAFAMCQKIARHLIKIISADSVEVHYYALESCIPSHIMATITTIRFINYSGSLFNTKTAFPQQNGTIELYGTGLDKVDMRQDESHQLKLVSAEVVANIESSKRILEAFANVVLLLDTLPAELNFLEESGRQIIVLGNAKHKFQMDDETTVVVIIDLLSAVTTLHPVVFKNIVVKKIIIYWDLLDNRNRNAQLWPFLLQLTDLEELIIMDVRGENRDLFESVVDNASLIKRNLINLRSLRFTMNIVAKVVQSLIIDQIEKAFENNTPREEFVIGLLTPTKNEAASSDDGSDITNIGDMCDIRGEAYHVYPLQFLKKPQ